MAKTAGKKTKVKKDVNSKSGNKDHPKRFIDMVLNESEQQEQIFRYVDEWFKSNTSERLCDYLGLTFEEFDAWVTEKCPLAEIVQLRREGKRFMVDYGNGFE